MFLGIDLGTGSVKAVLVGESGAVLGGRSAAYEVHSPRRGRAESDPRDWLEATKRAVSGVVGDRGSKVRGVGLSGQMHGVVACDARADPLRPAILWADARSTTQLASYRALDPETLRRLGNPPAVGMAGPTLLWLRENEPQTHREAAYFLQPKDWLRLRLTGEAATEPSDASATLLYDLQNDRWDGSLLDALGLGGESLPGVVPSASVAGTLFGGLAREMGLRGDTPVAAGAADTAAAILGAGLSGEGVFQLTVGSGAQVVALRPRFDPDESERTHLFRTVEGLKSGSPFYAMAAMQGAGLSLEWVRAVIGASWDEVYDEAFSAPPGSGGVTFVPHLGGERTPGFAPDARGSWSGLGLDHDRRHLLRAALEGVAFSIREGLQSLEDTAGGAREIRLAGGGAMDERWRRMLAGVLGRGLAPLPDTVSANASARGAALLAARSVGSPVEGPTDIGAHPVEPGASDDEVEAYSGAYLRYLEVRGGD